MRILSQIKFISILSLGFLCACQTSKPPVQKSNLTHGTVKSKIVKGQTTQAEILKLLGSPNIVTKNKEKMEVWTYSKQSSDTKSGSVGAGFLAGSLIFGGGSSAYSNTSTSTFDLIITFDKNDVVHDFSVVSSQF